MVQIYLQTSEYISIKMIQECHSFNIVFESIYYFDNAFENFMAFKFSEYQNNENMILLLFKIFISRVC